MVAPVLVGADKEHLHAGLPAVTVQRNYVSLGGVLRIDTLGGLHLGQGFDPVAQGCGTLKLHGFAGVLHLLCQRFLNTLGATLQELLGVADGSRVIFFGHQTTTGTRTAFDLILQARARARFKITVGTIAQQEHTLQLVERTVDRARARERAIVIAFLLFRAAMFFDHRVSVIFRHQNIGKGFVVTQQDIVARFQLLDQVLLKQQRLGLRPCRQEHHRRSFADHPRDAGRMIAGARIIRHPRL